MSTFVPSWRLVRAAASRRLEQGRLHFPDRRLHTQHARRLDRLGFSLRSDNTGRGARSGRARPASVAAAALLLLLVFALVATASASHGASANGAGGPKIKEFLLPTPDARPLGITTGPDRNVWFVEFLGNKVGHITRSGRVTEFPIPTPNSTPDAIVTGPDGNLWFTEESHNAVGRITPVPSSRSSPPASRPAAPAGSSRARTATSGSPWRAATARSRA
jgi:streptogramin lyase